ncbi:NAD(P)H-dependent flavin oxidoreductase YrpB (nitropropane dioxygenase family) [Thermocatellispora tengchongensis]|uniref:NAD(P)H-dependent flavin oxidoreductase YrpB (Nitropropane dioxygenase family) n=1 Tax=Thermocatellispora tengchongensis TaxID=1073253 RepID=A0A840P720_9ACTN|nr:nitronate monooxygenase family protein [Thermocatellispora tengchongensis]MBB5131815.1 NAD(P)H-dependent flavin oxidoreductase YrpB (nitropropane dioxygenase family) [Thermocatellispora tengchongensis]
MRTPICARFGIDFPLFAFSHCRDVVAAVTNAGGFGVLGATGYSPQQLDAELRWLDDRVGGRPYGVDVLVPGKIDASVADRDSRLMEHIPERHRDFVAHLFNKYAVSSIDPVTGSFSAHADEFGRRVTAEGATGLIEVALKHPIGLIASALGPPPPEMVSLAREAHVPVAALVGSVEHARRQVAAGVDLIVAQGCEAGGHTGEVSTMVLVPQVVDAVDVPVLAAGGIASGRQMAAALALGAEGVWCGSVWLTTEEAETPPAVKRKMLAATSLDTTRSRSRTGKPARQLKSAWTEEWDEATESPGPLPMPLQMLIAESAMARISRSAEFGNEGAQKLANYFVGQVVGQLNQVKPARRVVYEMIAEFGDALARLNRMTST